jgi:LPS sulfotransferase NodH
MYSKKKNKPLPKPIQTLKDILWVLQKRITSTVLHHNTSYTQFMICSQPRSGSTYLEELLNSHPHICSYGEFIDQDRTRTTDHKICLYDTLREKNPLKFLQKYIYVAHSSKTRAVGTKIMLNNQQLFRGKNKKLMQHIANSQNIRIIHLVRKNELEKVASHKIARIRKKFHETKNQKNNITITLDFERCMKRFERNNTNNERFADLVSQHPCIQVDYDELCASPEKILKKILTFLGVSQIPLKAKLRKIEHRPLKKIILNYDELKKKFKKTPYYSFFTK